MNEDQSKRISELEAQLAEKEKLANEQKARIADLEAKLAAKPADESKQVIEEKKPAEAAPKNDVEQFVDTYNSARELFAEV